MRAHARMGPATGGDCTYRVELRSATRLFEVVVVRRSDQPVVRTLAVVLSPPALAGTYIDLAEVEASSFVAAIRLSTMKAPLVLATEQHFGALPLVDLGYLDVAAFRHPELDPVAEVSDGGGWCRRFTHPATGRELVEWSDGDERVTARTVRKAAGPRRRWSCDFPTEATGLDGGLPVQGQTAMESESGAYAIGMAVTRTGSWAEVHDGWLDADSWTDPDRRQRRAASLG